MSKIVDKHLATPAQQCEDLSGAALGYANCFTAFLALIFGGILSISIFFAELFRRKAKNFGKGQGRKKNDLQKEYAMYDNLSKEELKMLLIQKVLFEQRIYKEN